MITRTSATEPEFQVQPQSIRFTSSTSHFGKVRLAIMEIGLCIIVPCVAFLVWVLCDTEIQMTLLSSSKGDISVPINRIVEMIPISADTVLSVETHGRIRFWNISDGRSFGENQSRLSHVSSAAYSPHDRLLAIGSITGKLEVWDLDHPDEPIAESMIDQFDIETCKFTPDGRYLCSAGSTREIRIWEPRTLTLVYTLKHGADTVPIRRLEITRDSRYLLAGDKRGNLLIWDLQNYTLVRMLNVGGHSAPSAGDIVHAMIEAIMLLPNGEEFVVVTRTEGISVWNISSGICTRRWHGGTAALHSACLSADGQRIFAGNHLGEIWTWEAATGRCLKSTAPHSTVVRSLACNRDGTVVISGDYRGAITCTQN